MKLHKLATLVLALAAAGAAHAQSVALEGNIPFSFTVSGKAMPAGDYRVDQDFASGTLTVRGDDGKSAAIALVMNNAPAGPQEAPRLLFHRYGDRYFLSQVWIPNKYHSTLHPAAIERGLSAKLRKQGEVLVALR